MRHIEFDISPAALLLYALLWFFDTDGIFAAALPAVAVHEAGHALFLRLGGLRVRSLRLGLAGLEMDYLGELHGGAGLFAIAAGPVFGLVYGGFIFSDQEYLRLSGGISLALSAFNLLPVLPLDGGRLLAMAAGERAEVISRGISLALMAVGLWLWLVRGLFSLFVMGAWLTWHNFKRQV